MTTNKSSSPIKQAKENIHEKMASHPAEEKGIDCRKNQSESISAALPDRRWFFFAVAESENAD
jgi:hypothetical protein